MDCLACLAPVLMLLMMHRPCHRPWRLDGGKPFIYICTYRVLVTTSRDPSSRLTQFAKELKLVLPNAQRINRGSQARRSTCHASYSGREGLHEAHGQQPQGRRAGHLHVGAATMPAPVPACHACQGRVMSGNENSVDASGFLASRSTILMGEVVCWPASADTMDHAQIHIFI